MSGILFETASDERIALKGGDAMKIGFIGAGKVGTTLGKCICDYYDKHKSSDGEKISVSGYYSRSIESTSESVHFTKTKIFDNLKTIVCASDILFITTEDSEIPRVWSCIAELEISNKIICHFSGSLSSDVFSKNDIKTGSFISTCSFHPVFAFSDKFSIYKQFNNVTFAAEGDKNACKTVGSIFSAMGHNIISISTENKVRYHAACVFASNFLVSLLHTSEEMLESCGFGQSEALDLIKGLALKNANTYFKSGAAHSLTGPLERADVQTIKKHLDVLSKTEYDEYMALSKGLLGIAREKNPERDYNSVEAILYEDIIILEKGKV